VRIPAALDFTAGRYTRKVISVGNLTDRAVKNFYKVSARTMGIEVQYSNFGKKKMEHL
jgi:hypothetical protein